MTEGRTTDERVQELLAHLHRLTQQIAASGGSTTLPRSSDRGDGGLGCRPVAVGDLVAFGVGHGCTTFDKGRAITMVDDDHTIQRIIRTYS